MTKLNFATQNGKPKLLSPRKRRLLEALLKGPVYRESADRIAGASNSPDIIRRLKNDNDLHITTHRPAQVDRDGFVTHPGLYVLERESVELARALLYGTEPPSDEES